MNKRGSVLDCGSPLPLCGRRARIKSARGLAHSKTLRQSARSEVERGAPPDNPCPSVFIRGLKSHVRVNRVPQNGETLDEFRDAAIEAPFGFEPGYGDTRVADDVVAFVRVFANRRLDKNELRQVLLNHGA